MRVPSRGGLLHPLQGAWKQEGIRGRAGGAPRVWKALSKEEATQTPSRHLFSACAFSSKDDSLFSVSLYTSFFFLILLEF